MVCDENPRYEKGKLRKRRRLQYNGNIMERTLTNGNKRATLRKRRCYYDFRGNES
jgi:hypothetical protein